MLGCAVADELYARFPQLSEGKLTRLRASLVREEARVIEPVTQPFLERRGPRQSVYWPDEFAAKSMYRPTFDASGTSLR